MARTGQKDTVWELEPHTEAKHRLLSGYLAAWFPILSRWNDRIVFLDGFAGPGIYKYGEPGSPTRALDVLLTHTYGAKMAGKQFVFIFNEAESDRHEKLSEIIAGYVAEHQPWPRNVTLQVGCDNFENMAEEMLRFLEEQKRNLAPTFAFVDPFGVSDMSMDLLRRLLSFDKCELFVYFNFNFVNRWAASGNVDDRLTELFGTDRFKQVAGLSGAPRKAFLHDLYQSQLMEVCGFPFVKSFEMIDKSGHTGYFLFYGTRNIKGLEVMKDVMWKVDPGGGQQFSDKLAGQDILFSGEGVDTDPLRCDLADHFRGETVSVEILEHYTLVDTPYALKHLRKLTLKPMQADGVITSPNQKKRFTYPAGTMITFAS